MPGFRDLRWMWVAGSDVGGNTPLFLNAVLAKCLRSQSLSLLMFPSTEEKGGIFG